MAEASILQYVVYSLVIAVVIATVVIVIDTFYPFLPINPLTGPSYAARASRTFWPQPTEQDGLTVAAADSPTVNGSSYTMSVQLVIADSRISSPTTLQHILHRGTAACPGSTPDIVMNPGVFLDAKTNDIHIFINTTGKEDGITVPYKEHVAVRDMPLGTPITLGIVNNGRTVEVYVNCRLYSTLLLKGTPVVTDNKWWGRYCPNSFSGIVKNLQLWGTPLGSADYMQLCTVGSVNTADLPQICAK